MGEPIREFESHLLRHLDYEGLPELARVLYTLLDFCDSFTMPQSDEETWKLWREQCRDQLRRDTESRLNGGLVYVHKPVLDDAERRVFDSTSDYRKWCHQNAPKYLGYGYPTARFKKIHSHPIGMG